LIIRISRTNKKENEAKSFSRVGVRVLFLPLKTTEKIRFDGWNDIKNCTYTYFGNGEQWWVVVRLGTKLVLGIGIVIN